MARDHSLSRRNSKAEGRRFFRLFPFGAKALLLSLCAGCAITATRPVQEMSDTTAALRAAREVQAQTLAPELYRQAQEWFLRARREYRLKNFKEAKEYADRSRVFAEQAEFEAIRNGASRESINVPPPPPPPPPSTPEPASSGSQGNWNPDDNIGNMGGGEPPADLPPGI